MALDEDQILFSFFQKYDDPTGEDEEYLANDII